MRIIILLIIAIIISGCFSTIPRFDNTTFNQDENLVMNGNFEQATDSGAPANWLIIGDKSIIFRVDSSFEDNRKSCLFLSNLGNETDIVSDYFDINPSEVFYCSAWFRSREESKRFLKLSIVAFDKNGKVVNTFLAEDFIDDNWKKIDLTSGFLSTSARYARVMITIPTGFKRSLWIDDVKCFAAYKFMK